MATTPMTTRGQRAGRLAAAQLGLLTHADARQAGYSDRQIRHEVALGRWVRVARGLYLINGAPVTDEQATLAACKAGAPATVASHLSAAFLFGLSDPPERPHVTVPHGSSARNPLAVVHRADLTNADRATNVITPCTSKARTLIDIAPLVSRCVLDRIVDEAFTEKGVQLDLVLRAIDRRPSGRGRAGIDALRSSLGPWLAGLRADSPAEVRLFRRLREWGFHDPVGQHVVRSSEGTFLGRVDLAWIGPRIAIEYQSRPFHGPRRTAADEARIALIEASGWKVHEADERDLRPSAVRLRTDLLASFGKRAA